MTETRYPARFFSHLVVISWAGALVADGVAACDGSCMAAVGSFGGPISQGARDVPVPVVGRHDSPVRAFSLAVGHDRSRLALQKIELGPLFADAELVSVAIHNESGHWGAHYGDVFKVLDLLQTIARWPISLPVGAAWGRD